MEVLYETNNTVVTPATIIRGSEIYQINQITDMAIYDDSKWKEDVYKKAVSDKETKSGCGIMLIIGAIVLFFMWKSIIFSAIVLVIGLGLWLFNRDTSNIKKEEPIYYLRISFSNVKSLEIQGEKDAILELHEAITKAMHMQRRS